jgi:hypothetical protein
MRAQMEAMRQLLHQQAQQMREQSQQLQQLRNLPPQPPVQSAVPQPASMSLAAQPASLSLAGPPQAARRREPRLSDLADYAGDSEELDEWLAALRRCTHFYHLSDLEAVEFAVVHLHESADLWWTAELTSSEQAAIVSPDTLAAAMRERFQPVTRSRKAREKLHALQQGARHIDEYVKEFNKLRAQVPDMAEPEARAQFVRGLRKDLAEKLEDDDWESMPLAAVVAKAARKGGRAASMQAQGKAATASQMEVDDGDGASLAERMDQLQATLNAMQASQSGNSDGSSVHTNNSAPVGRGFGSQRGGAWRGGRGGGFGARGGSSRPAFPPPVPGVPREVVEQRYAAKQCFRCGDPNHPYAKCQNPAKPSF